MRRFLAIALLLLAALGAAMPLIAQESAEADKSVFLRFVEDRISAPGRRIAINGLEGALSSDVTIREITISDDEGVWLRIKNAHLLWNQGALLTGRLQIDELTADSIDYIRAAVPPKGAKPPAPEAGGFEVPVFPVAISLDKLSVPSVTFGQDVFGLGSEIGLEGSLRLEGGSLDTRLDITRKDGPGGTLKLAVDYDKASKQMALDINLREPENGVIANLLNIENRPAIDFRVTGSGPVASLATSLTLDAGGKRALTGLARLSQDAQGTAVKADLHGPVADLVPAPYRRFFGEQTRLTAGGLLRAGGGFRLDTFTISGGELDLSASADTAPDGFLDRLQLEAQIAGTGGADVLLPVAGQSTTIAGARLHVDYGEGQSWSGTLRIDDLDTGAMAAKSIGLDLSGAAVNLGDPAARRVTFNADGSIDGITAADPQIADALGSSVGIGAAGLWQAGEPVRIAQIRLAGKALSIALAGTLDEFTYDGTVRVDTPSIAPFSGLAGRQLGGALDLSAKGTIALLTGGFDLDLDGTAEDLATGTPALDNILVGQTTLGGSIGRTEEGISATDFRIASSHASVTANGNFSSIAADFGFGVSLDDLGLVSENASGALNITGTAKGRDGPIAIALHAETPSGTVAGHRLNDAALALDGSLDGGAFTGTLAGSASLDGYAVTLSSDLASKDGSDVLSGLDFRAPGTVLTGNVTRNADGLFDGRLDLKAGDVTMAAAMLLRKATGAVDASIVLSGNRDGQSANVEASVHGLESAGTVIGSADISAAVQNLFGVPVIRGQLAGTDIAAAGIRIARLHANADTAGATTNFTADATLDNATTIKVVGNLTPREGGFSVGLDRAELAQGLLAASLSAPTTLTVAGDSVALDDVRLAVGSGRISASGTAGNALDLRIEVTALPLAVANTVRPDLGLGGTLDGTVDITGTAGKPLIAFKAEARDITAAQLETLQIGRLSASAEGRFADSTLRLANAHIAGPEGFTATASGTMPLVGTNGDLNIQGTVPLTLANRLVGVRGTQLAGTANVDARVTGSLARPQFAGSVSTANAGVVDPQSNLRLENIALQASLQGRQAVIDRFTGNLATGGSVTAGGTVALDGDMAADLAIRLDSARYADGNLFVATVSGDLTLTGGLLASPLLKGRLAIEKAEISIPDLGPGSGALIDVDHVHTPPAVAATLDRALPAAGADTGTGGGTLRLDIALSAPNQVFVRGRGLDVELGGSVRLTGPIGNIQPVGGFQLVRGRLSLLGQRIVFTSGRLTLVGDLDPYVNLSARSEGDTATVFVNVTGPVSNLDIAFTSEPELPQDEVLALLLFKRPLSDLSPFQIARLAAAAAELAGGSNTSVVDSLREAAGLDDLDVITDAEGNTAVRAGRYIQDNVYVNVEAGAQGNSKVSIDLDLSDSVKARASAGENGDSSVGIFYEQDY